jgi:hypothetical protein
MTRKPIGLSVPHRKASPAPKTSNGKPLTQEQRERIAKLVEDMGIEGYGTLAIAVAIRAGGKP